MNAPKLHTAILQKQPWVILAVCGKDLPELNFTVAGKKYSAQEGSIWQRCKRGYFFPTKIYKRATQI